jgi:hypothetical protein
LLLTGQKKRLRMPKDPAETLIESLRGLAPERRAEIRDWLGIRRTTVAESEEIEARLALSLRLRALGADERPN